MNSTPIVSVDNLYYLSDFHGLNIWRTRLYNYTVNSNYCMFKRN